MRDLQEPPAAADRGFAAQGQEAVAGRVDPSGFRAAAPFQRLLPWLLGGASFPSGSFCRRRWGRGLVQTDVRRSPCPREGYLALGVMPELRVRRDRLLSQRRPAGGEHLFRCHASNDCADAARTADFAIAFYYGVRFAKVDAGAEGTDWAPSSPFLGLRPQQHHAAISNGNPQISRDRVIRFGFLGRVVLAPDGLPGL